MEREAQLPIQISSTLYRLLARRADETNSTPEQVAETILRFQLGNSAHVEQRMTPFGIQPYLRGTRVAVRHVAAFLRAGFTVEEILSEGLPQIPPAAIHEAIAYYYDNRREIDSELDAEDAESTLALMRERLSPEQYYQLTHRPAQ